MQNCEEKNTDPGCLEKNNDMFEYLNTPWSYGHKMIWL